MDTYSDVNLNPPEMKPVFNFSDASDHMFPLLNIFNSTSLGNNNGAIGQNNHLLPPEMKDELVQKIHNLSIEHSLPMQEILNSASFGNTNASKENDHSLLIKTKSELAGLYTAYIIVFLVSLFANSLVCYVIVKNKRFRTVTYAFIANLSASDLTITIFNIPFNLMRFTLKDWIVGEFLCQISNLTLMSCIYSSTFTMAAIALDRYMVILYPLRPRLSFGVGIIIVIVTWTIGICMSLPFAIYARVTEVPLMLQATAVRCRMCYPEPTDTYKKYLTLATFLAQFVVPMVFAGIAYGQIVQKLWSRQLVGQATDNQKINHDKTRKRTIKMLIVVVLVFVVCWLPLNMYHILTDFHPNTDLYYYNSTVFLTCHWLAISSCCYNPFIYCWFNGNFRQVLRSRFSRKKKRDICIRPGNEMEKTFDVRYAKYRMLGRMRIGSGNNSSGTKSTCRSGKFSSKRDRNPRRAEFGRGNKNYNYPVLNTV